MTYQTPTTESPATATDHTPANTTLDTLPTDGFIRVMPLAKLLGVHHQTLRKWWKTGKFPKPQHRNGILLFKNTDIKQWIDKQPQIIA